MTHAGGHGVPRAKGPVSQYPAPVKGHAPEGRRRAPQPQLRAHLAPGASLPGLAAGSGERFRGGKWRTERDCGRTFSGLDGSLLGFLAKEFKGLFILTGEAAHPYRGQHVDICRIIRRFIG